MASSQVEIASNPPFDCILRDHNRRDRYGRESRAAFQKNLKDLVRDRLQSCISSSSTKSDSDSNENKNLSTENAESKSQSNKPHHIRRKSKANERWNRAREIVFAIDNPEGPNHGGVSSLVKKWRDFEEESKNKNSNKSNSSSPLNENPLIETSQVKSEPAESIDERIENSTMTDESLPNWESDTTANSNSRPTSAAGRDSDGSENERIKVADIIRKLKNENVCNESILRVRTASDPTENRGLCQVICSPRIRGRQALSDLLIRMGQDRLHELEGLGERKPVSRFSHKGRIQALLRVKLLRRGSELRDNRLLSPTMIKLNGLVRGSTIMHLRERFSALVDHCASNPTLINYSPDSENSSSLNQTTEEIDKTQEPENSSTTDQHQVISSTSRLIKAVNITTTPQAEIPPTSKRPREEIHRLEVSASTNHPKEAVDKTSNIEHSSTTKRPREEIRHHEVTCSTSNHAEVLDDKFKKDTHHEDAIQEMDPICEFVPRESGNESDKKHLEGQVDGQEAVNAEIRETDDESRDSSPQSEGEEEWTVEGNTNDWINDIARPKSDWEGLRKARYQEMLDPYMENGDIRVLLQRRSVSTFLSSDLKERIERLMISRTQGQPPLMYAEQCHYEQQEEDEYDDDDEEEGDEYDDEEKDGYDEDEDDDEEEEEEEEEEESSPIIGIQYNKVGEFFDRQPSSSLHSRWRSNRSDDLDQLASPSLMQSPSSNSYSQSSRRHSSVEMELIYDLRGHMEQLHREMFEIRKSIQSCVSMQAKLQRSIKHKVVVNNSVRREMKESYRRVPKNGNCSICREMPVDSLLYRCGHMCTCFKCAHDLQWSGGKCPICTAPILDIVRPYAR